MRSFLAFVRLCFFLNHGVGDNFFEGSKGTVLSRSDSTTLFILPHCTAMLSSVVVSLQFSSPAKAVSLAVFSSPGTEWIDEDFNHCVVTEA